MACACWPAGFRQTVVYMARTVSHPFKGLAVNIVVWKPGQPLRQCLYMFEFLPRAGSTLLGSINVPLPAFSCTSTPCTTCHPQQVHPSEQACNLQTLIKATIVNCSSLLLLHRHLRQPQVVQR